MNKVHEQNRVAVRAITETDQTDHEHSAVVQKRTVVQNREQVAVVVLKAAVADV